MQLFHDYLDMGDKELQYVVARGLTPTSVFSERTRKSFPVSVDCELDFGISPTDLYLVVHITAGSVARFDLRCQQRNPPTAALSQRDGYPTVQPFVGVREGPQLIADHRQTVYLVSLPQLGSL